MKPKIICHMLTSVDGKITGAYMDAEIIDAIAKQYEHINEEYKSQAWLCGRVTTDENFTFYNKPLLDFNPPIVPEGDFIANDNAPMYYVSIDTSGKIGWKSNELSYENRPKAHIIEVLSEQTSNEYKSFLRKLNISYLIAGKNKLNCELLCEKLFNKFNIKTLMLSGGGYINGSFLNAGLIDEL